MATTWDPANTAAALTLSGGNLTATMTTLTGGGATNAVARSTTSQASGKFYFEFTAGGRDSAGGWLIGIGNASQSLTLSTGGANSIVSQMTPGNNGITLINSASLGNDGLTPSSTQGSIAVDLTARRIWTRQVNPLTSWNSNVTFDPATGVGGYSFSGLAGPYFIFFRAQGSTPADIGTLNPGPSSFLGAIPAGFSAWDAGVVVSSAANFFFAA